MWCHAAVRLHQHFGLKEQHFVVVETCFWSNSLSVFDSMSNKAFLDTSYALEHMLATAFKPILNVSNRNSEWTFEIPLGQFKMFHNNLKHVTVHCMQLLDYVPESLYVSANGIHIFDC